MATCANCNQPLEPDSAFCGFCGAAVSATTEMSGARDQTVPPAGGPTPGAGYGRPVPPPSQPATANPVLTNRGFFASLFDFSFTSLVTTKIIKALYVISVIVIGLSSLGLVVAAFHRSAAAGLVVLIIVAPLVALLWLIYTRVILELFIAHFPIAENTSELVAQGRADR
jgi:hypothetical protein